MVLANILNRFKKPPHSQWKYQKQTNPPSFGYARFVSSTYLEREIAKRKTWCLDQIQNASKLCHLSEGKISLVVLSCQRWPTLKRFIESMQPFFKSIELYKNIEKILVDNGSGEELLNKVKNTHFFDHIIAFPTNLGLIGALKKAYPLVDGEYILLLEDDFVLDFNAPFIEKCLDVFSEFPEIGIIRLKNQNNWWKPHRVIGPLRKTRGGNEFWTWFPSQGGELNVWCSGSVMFRKVSYYSVGELPHIHGNPSRSKKNHQGYIYECVYGKKYNQYWLAAKLKDVYPFFQPNDNEECSGWNAK